MVSSIIAAVVAALLNWLIQQQKLKEADYARLKSILDEYAKRAEEHRQQAGSDDDSEPSYELLDSSDQKDREQFLSEDSRKAKDTSSTSYDL